MGITPTPTLTLTPAFSLRPRALAANEGFLQYRLLRRRVTCLSSPGLWCLRARLWL